MSLKINNRRTYTIDDYINDKNKPAMYVGSGTTGLRQVSGSRADQYRSMMALSAASQNQVYGPPAPLQFFGQTSGAGHGTPTVAVTADGQVSNSSAAVAPINKGSKPGTSNGAAAGTGNAAADTGGGEAEDTGLTAEQIYSAFVTNDMQNMMNSTLREIYEMGRRGFVYNEKDSPLYAILQQQAAKEARIASGRAYSRAVANAGGFGSSYATLAAEEASRQVMEGWDDNQLALYQAAKEEWDSKYQSKIDEYNFLKGEKESAEALYTGAVSALRTAYGVTYDEAAMTADLQAMGLNDEQIKAVLANQKQYSDAMASSSLTAQSAIEALRGKYGEDEYNEEQMRLYLGSLNYSDEAINEALSYWKQYSDTVNETKEPEKISDTAQEALAEWQAVHGSEYGEESMRAYLRGRGYEEDDINQAVAAQRSIKAGAVLDKKATNASEAITYGAELNNALANGILTQEEYAVAQKRNSEVIRADVMNQLSGDLTDEEAGEYLKEAAQYTREGYMTVDDFKNILRNQMSGVLVDAQAESKGGKIDTLKEARGIITSVQAYMEFVENGTMTESDFEEMLDFFKNNDVMKAAYEHLDFIAGNDGTIDRLSEDENEALSVIFAAMDSPQKAELRQLEKDYEEFTNLNSQLITLESQYAQAGYENPRAQAEKDLPDVVARINEIGSKYGVDPFTGELKRLLRDWRKR